MLDLASHDGRWSYALSAAGAASVSASRRARTRSSSFAAYPDGETKHRVTLVHGDVYDELPKLIERGDTFDVVAMFGFFYHVMDHYGLLKLVKQLAPGLVVIDSEFHLAPEATIRLAIEPTDSHLNSIAHEPGQEIAPVGIPSRRATEVMAGSLGFDVEWADWDRLPPRRRAGLKAYYRQPPAWKRRGTCALRPRVAAIRRSPSGRPRTPPPWPRRGAARSAGRCPRGTRGSRTPS